MKLRVFGALLLALMSAPTFAQMVSQPTDSYAAIASSATGQTFTATASASISRISVRPIDGDFSGTLYIYNGNSGSGVPFSVGTPAYTQTGVTLSGSSSGGPMRDIVLTTPFAVTAGSTYSFVLEGPGLLAAAVADVYPGGMAILDYADLTASTWDLAFQVWAVSPQAITYTSTAPAAAKVGGSYTVTATGGASGNSVVFTIDPSASAVCSVAGATVSLTGIGTCTINANQAGNASYDPAPQVQQSFAVAARPLPVAAADNYTTTRNTPLIVAAPGVLGNDSSPLALPLTVVPVSLPAHGSFAFNLDGSFYYTPNAGFIGTDTFTYSAFDGFGTPPVTVTITVTPPLAPASIPTLSEWGLLALSSLMGLFALGRVRRR
ncbi:putative outer membrane adhesin like protein [Acidovorax delafieldii 2AN]|jgi:hypothetical protein|uniref:Putative outer membrane adhesin like protein n=1 Tax=Acidovorax delafieldii 2AN TaxID=573060 RepID=C5T4P7_ACIDE|nr:IPTL-CTERM sorting domain-containing protein [Acidovorax delafieldii]EER60540.1 putative outer membrane adhesin like protein [Acidovorax delafieldii 2AN]